MRKLRSRLFLVYTSMKKYTFIMQKTTDGAVVKDSYTDFDIVCTEVPFTHFADTKELPSNDWGGEDGEDVYIPKTLPLKAYDMTLNLCYKGPVETAYLAIKSFRDYLIGADGDGAALKVYMPYTGIGRTDVYLKSFSPEDFWLDTDEEVVLFNITFRVTNPKDNYIPTYSGDTIVSIDKEG